MIAERNAFIAAERHRARLAAEHTGQRVITAPRLCVAIAVVLATFYAVWPVTPPPAPQVVLDGSLASKHVCHDVLGDALVQLGGILVRVRDTTCAGL
jgi:hypothetical protein